MGGGCCSYKRGGGVKEKKKREKETFSRFKRPTPLPEKPETRSRKGQTSTCTLECAFAKAFSLDTKGKVVELRTGLLWPPPCRRQSTNSIVHLSPLSLFLSLSLLGQLVATALLPNRKRKGEGEEKRRKPFFESCQPNLSHASRERREEEESGRDKK